MRGDYKIYYQLPISTPLNNVRNSQTCTHREKTWYVLQNCIVVCFDYKITILRHMLHDSVVFLKIRIS